MDDDFIREQVEALAERSPRAQATTIARIVLACWPGGTADRSEPIAQRWLRRWRPATSNLVLPVCSCAKGRCALCN